MLTGRESLVRLIGRRRRSPLPASLGALLSPSSLASAQANVDGSGSGEAASEAAGPSSGGGAEWVTCPVCGESIRGSDYCVNTHLDICLTRGAKRKLTQSSLFNFRFSKKVAVEPTSKSLDNELETKAMNQFDEDSSSDKAFLSLNSETVLYAVSACKEMLGYLPRELAKLLALLFDKQYVECEGFVVSFPEQKPDSVPIRITIQKCKTDNSSSDVLWENFINAVRNGNFQGPSNARYQRNFNVMITDVMASHTHVFSNEENSFLGSFKSLSNDAQRLFVRIYTRKGPWFRMSSISYSEISDLQHAFMELKLAGYIVMLSCTDDPTEYDMKEIIEVLSVPEMKEILKELPKDDTSCARRHELLSTLLSLYHDGTCTTKANPKTDRSLYKNF